VKHRQEDRLDILAFNTARLSAIVAKFIPGNHALHRAASQVQNDLLRDYPFMLCPGCKGRLYPLGTGQEGRDGYKCTGTCRETFVRKGQNLVLDRWTPKQEFRPKDSAFVEDPRLPFGQVLKSCRERAGLNQKELAEKMGMHNTYVSVMEKRSKWPHRATILKLMRHLGEEFQAAIPVKFQK